MQKKHLMAGSAIGGFLLATTALTSSASAQMLIGGNAVDTSVGGEIHTERVTATGSTLSVGPFDLLYNLGGNFSDATVRLQIDSNLGTFGADVTVGSAASAAYETDVATDTSNVNLISALPAAASAVSITNTSLSSFGSQIAVTYLIRAASVVRSLAVEEIELSQVQGLATAGTSLTLTSSLFQGDATSSSQSDTVTLLTSAAPASVSVASAAALTADAEATPPFSAFDTATSGGGLLATVNVVGNTASLANLTANEAPSNVIGGLTVTTTSPVLSLSGVAGASVIVNGSTNSISLGAIATTTGVFTSGTIAAANFAAGTSSVQVIALFDGTTAIETADAGTVTATLSGTSTSVLATASGSTATVIRNGITAEVNYFQGAGDSFGTTTFQSFLRISNSGTVAGAATISAVDGDGNAIGTAYSTSSIPVNGQIQLSNSDIETGLGITGGQSGQYTVFITGPFQGYVQHVMLNNTTSAFTNLTGFRSNSGANTSLIP